MVVKQNTASTWDWLGEGDPGREPHRTSPLPLFGEEGLGFNNLPGQLRIIANNRFCFLFFAKLSAEAGGLCRYNILRGR